MDLQRIFSESHELAEELLSLVNLPLFDDSARVSIADVACSLSIEHWTSVRALLENGLLSSALVVHRAQFEAVVRSVWLTYCASDSDVDKFSAELSLETEQAAKNAPQTQLMMESIQKHAPMEAHAALERFKSNSWKALNSYAHAGIHPLRRHAEGYPLLLVHGMLCNANGLGVIACMQSAVLCGVQPLQRQLLDLAAKHSLCMPAPL